MRAQGMARPSMIRSESTSSTLSCITVLNNNSTTFSDASPSTPPTSNTDVASVSSNGPVKPEPLPSDTQRVSRVRGKIGSLRSQSHSRKVKKVLVERTPQGGIRAAVNDTLLPDDLDKQTKLMQKSIQVLDLDWRVDAMPGDEIKQSLPQSAGSNRRKRTRVDLLETASSAAMKTKTVLGKRSRVVFESGKEKLQNLSRRASLRPRGLRLEGPVKKKTRSSLPIDLKRVSSPPLKLKRQPAEGPKVKRWLSQGLYVGQERDFDARLTETKNNLKRSSACLPSGQQRSTLPLPMFAGQRTLELGRDFNLPFDVFSPLPAGQPKPEEWRKTQKNVFVGDAAQVWKVTKHLEASTCICQADSGCGENCFNRFMFYECDDTNCNIGAGRCTNRSFEALRQRYKAGGKYNVGVEVIKTVNRGYGVRSNRTFEPNQIIVEYAGEIITQDECDERMRHRYKDNECYYLMSFDQNMIIDATRGSIARFVNHSCEPNCKMIKWTVAGKPRMALFAGDKGIMTGEELTYDYNFDPFSSKNIQECYCGSASCRGFLGPKPKDQAPSKSKDIKDALKPLVASSTKRKIQQVIKGSVESVACKKRKIAMPSSIQSTLKTTKTQASMHFAKAKILASPNAKNDRVVKKASQRSLRGSKRAQTVRMMGNRAKIITAVTHTRRNPSDMPGKWESSKETRSLSRRNSTQVAAASIRKNVVHTLKGSTRTRPNKKTIRVIGHDAA